MTSDSHFCHRNIIRFCHRPFSDVGAMNEALIRTWNDRVSPDDDVYHLGDFAFANPEKIMSIATRLNGRIHLILGNHDDPDMHDLPCWTSVQNYKEVAVDGSKVVLSHYAMRAWNGSHKGSYMFYGHTHNNLPPINRSIDVGVDYPAWQYGPVTFEMVVKELDHRGLNEVPVFPPKGQEKWEK